MEWIIYEKVPIAFINFVHIVWSTKYRYSVLKGEVQTRYWGQHLWGIGYGAWSTGNIIDEMIEQYLDHHKNGPNSDQNFILE